MGADVVLGVIVVLVGVIGAAHLFSARRQLQPRQDERALPAELRGAVVVFAERTFRSGRHRLVARLDRAYGVGGTVVLVEFKTRNEDVVHATDIVELSVQRVAVQDELGVAVAREGWVVIENRTTGSRSSHRVALLDQAEVVRLRQRYLDVKAGRELVVSAARSAGQCRSCGHRDACRFSKASSAIWAAGSG